jgi:hypothetical protein
MFTEDAEKAFAKEYNSCSFFGGKLTVAWESQ